MVGEVQSSMRGKKILLIIPEMSMGGAQRSISKLSIELAMHHTVWLVIFNKVGGIAYAHSGELINLDVVPGGGIFNKIKSFIQRIDRLRKLKRDLDIDVSISFLEGADYINILSKVRDRIILSIRGSKQHDETIRGKFSLLRNKVLIPWLYRKADLIVTVNQGIANELRTLYGLEKSNIITIGNFYNTEEIKALAREPRNDNLTRLYSNPMLIVTGRLAIEKGLKQLLQIFHQLKIKHKNLRIVFIGNGPELSDLVSSANQLNLRVHVGSDFPESSDVIFLGNQSNVFTILKGATVFLMNSSSEGFPNGMVEAMICGVPVVSSDCPYGPREILAPEFPYKSSITEPYFSHYGVLMPMIKTTNDARIWVEMLHDLLGKKELLSQLAKNGLQRVDQFKKELIVEMWFKALE